MWGRYLVATLAVAIVVAVRVVARPVLHTDIPWISFSPAVLVAAWYGGVGPGLAAILLSVVASDYFLLEPHGALGLRTASQVSGAGVFVLSGALMTALIERARKAMVERERVLAATRGQRDLLQSIIAGAPAAIALLEGPNHRFIVANPGYYALARGKGAMIGRTVEEVWPEIAETVGILLDRVFYTGVAYHAADAPMEVVRDRGRETAYFTFAYEPLRDEDGAVRHILVLARETTEEVQARRERERAQEALQDANEKLQANSEELAAANEQLQAQTEELQAHLVTMREQAEALRESEERLRATFENAGVGIVEAAGEEDRFVAANDRICRILGYSREQLLGTTVHDLTYPADRANSDYLNAQLHAGSRDRFDYEKRFLKGDGSPLWVHVTVSAVPDAGGRWQHSIATVEDISERKQAEEALREANQALAHRNADLEAERARWQGVVEGIADEVWTCDAQGRMSLINLPAVTGMGLEEFKDLPVERVLEEVEILNADGQVRRTEDSPLLRSLRGEIVRGEEIMVHRRTGRRRWRQLSSAPTRDATGAITGAVAIVRDVTEAKETQEALRQSEEQLRLATLAAEIGVWSWTPGTPHVIVSVNWRRLFGIAPDAEVTFETWANALHPEDRERAVQQLNAASEEHREFNTEYRVVRPDGTVRWVVDRGRAWYDESGRALGMAGVNVDMTERKEMEDDLREADRRKDEFLAMLSHELRNPLAAITSAVHLMGERGLDDPMLERARDVSERQSAHMGRLLDDLLDVSRVTQGRIALQQEDIDLAAVIESGVEAATPLIEGKGHTLDVSLPDTPLHLHGDPVRLAQVVDNLLTNAAKYTPPGGHISLDVRSAGCEMGSGAAASHSALPTPHFCAEIRVRDDGAGIAPDLLPHVFDLFVQGERSLARTEGGLGIGLTMVRNLVELHGGRVEARSDGPGQGSEFVVALPLAGGPEPQTRNPEPSPELRALDPQRRILVVDDNADMAEMLAMTLEADGHDVATALSGPTALDVAGDYRPDVVLLDLGMPGMDGYEVARRLRQMPELAETPLVAVTGYGQEEDLRHTREAGFDAHLVKPVDMDALRRVLAGRGAGAKG